MSSPEIFDEYAQKIADIIRVPLPYVLQIRDQGLLNNKAVRDLLIKNDYIRLTKTKKFTRNQILEKLSGIYDVDKRKIQTVASTKYKNLYFCSKCGSQVSKLEHLRNDGQCDRCYSQLINL